MEAAKYPEWKELFEFAKDWPYGSEHQHKEISKILRLPMETSKYYRAVSRCNKELRRTSQRHLVVIPGHGYRVLKPDEFLTEAGKIMKQAARRINKGYEVAYATPVHMLNDDQQNRWTGFMERGLRLKAMFDAERHELRKIADGKLKIAVGNDRQKLF